MERKHVQLVKIEVGGVFVAAKECTSCGEIKALDLYNSKKNGLGKRDSRCKACKKLYRDDRKYLKAEYDKKYREENADKVRENKSRWYEENKEYANDKKRQWYYENHERELAVRRKYYQENREALNEQKKLYYKENEDKFKKYREENRERILAYNRRRYHENKEQYAERWKRYYEENKDYHRERGIKYYYENWEARRGINKKWFRENKERAQLIGMRRRTRERLLPDDITSEQVDEITSFFGGCSLTGESADLHLDHVIPIATGHGGAVYGNVIPLKSYLNESKRDKNIFEWFEQNKDRWELSQDKFDTLIEYLAAQNGVSIEEYRDYVYWCHENPIEVVVGFSESDAPTQSF